MSLLVGVALSFMVLGVYLKGDANGYNRRDRENNEAIAVAEGEAIKINTQVKKEAQIVYKYIREQDESCDIYSDVIRMLPNPTSGGE